VKREELSVSSVGAHLSTSSSASFAASAATTPSLLSYDRKTDPAIIATKQKEILNKNGGAFARLIADVKRRNLREAAE
jgi:hypothetical protein